MNIATGQREIHSPLNDRNVQTGVVMNETQNLEVAIVQAHLCEESVKKGYDPLDV